MKKSINLIFPHQLFSESPLLENGHDVYLIEEYLFFRQFKFHKQKIAFHRASMKSYCAYVEARGTKVHYIESDHELSDIRQFGKELKDQAISEIHFVDPTDDWLEERIRSVAEGYQLKMYTNPQFLNTKKELASFFRADKKSFFQTTFYKQQRKKRGILLDDKEEPIGGKWTFDSENRKKYPKGKTPPEVHFPAPIDHWDEAVDYTTKMFGENPGSISKNRLYPITHAGGEGLA